MTTLPAQTPGAVKEAVSVYARRRRNVAVATVALAGLAVFIGVMLLFMLIDRYAEVGTRFRSIGPWLAWLTLIATATCGVIVWLRRYPPFTIAVWLDRAFPENRDRLSTSLDLAERRAAGQNVGDEDCVARLFDETNAFSPAKASTVVHTRAMRFALVGAIVSLAILLFLLISPAFRLPLLMKRFWQPHRDLPRDSSTLIVVEEINGKPYTGDAQLAPLPENSDFSLRVALRRKPGALALFSKPAPMIPDDTTLAPQMETAGESIDLLRSGDGWTLTRPRLASSMSFRLSADDALTQTFTQSVTPRIRLSKVLHTIRYPRYSKLANVMQQPLGGGRLSVLLESQLEFQIICDAAFTSIDATLDPIAKSTGAPGDPTQKAQPPIAARRTLRVQRLNPETGRISFAADESGVLRIRATGANGLASEEWTCVIEVVPDQSPRVIVTGIENDTTIIPGELVAYQYRSEDDLAIKDVVMEWTVAGGATSDDLSGEEYLKSDQFGQKVVTGQELIQRMNYKTYATEPFEFQLVAYDSKGQEARSEKFRIHILADDYAARFARGQKLLNDVAASASRRVSMMSQLNNHLNVISTAVGENKTWKAQQLDPLLANWFQAAAQADDPQLALFGAVLRFGGVPLRLERSLQLFYATPDALASSGELITAGLKLKASADVPATVKEIRAGLEREIAIATVWAQAVDAEKKRFESERLLMAASTLSQRLATISAPRSAKPPATRPSSSMSNDESSAATAANLKFYLTQVETLVNDSKAQCAPQAEALQAARQTEKPDAIVAALGALSQALSNQRPAPTTQISALAAQVTKPSPLSTSPDHVATLVARVATGRAGTSLRTPMSAIGLSRVWMSMPAVAAPADGAWFDAPVDASDVWIASSQILESLRTHRANLIAHRYDLNPQEARDREAALREDAIVVLQMVERCATLDAAAKQRLGAALQPVAAGGEALSASLVQGAAPIVALRDVVRESGSKQLAASDPGDAAERANFALLAASLKRIADRYDQHAGAARQEAAAQAAPDALTAPGSGGNPLLLRDNARRLQVQIDALDGCNRSAEFVSLESKVLRDVAKPEWAALEPRFGMQIALSHLSSLAESVCRLHADIMYPPGPKPKSYEGVADKSQALAARARQFAAVFDALAQGQPVQFDFAAIERESRTGGVMENLKTEYEWVRPFMQSVDAARTPESQEKFAKTALGRVASAEQKLSRGPAAHSAATTAPSEDEGTLRAAAQLPPVNITSRSNKRAQSRDSMDLWQIEGVVRQSDRRWLIAMRDAELGLMRAMVDEDAVNTSPIDATTPADVALAYANLVELRWRNVANERRRNAGISGLLAQQAGPTLKLPEHIAAEFMRARSAPTPEAFKDRIDAYYEELYRELAK